MEVHRMFAGVDHRIVDALFVCGGFALYNMVIHPGHAVWEYTRLRN
jgi:hypothetical protein